MNIAQLLAEIVKTQINVEFNHLCLDARQIKKDDVFVALKGTKEHGANYIDQAIKNGCSCVLVDTQTITCAVPSIRINNLKKHLPKLASRAYPKAQKVDVIGVTGTNGKTTVGSFIQQLLKHLGVNCGLIGTLGIHNSRIKTNHTTPDIFTLYRALDEYAKNNTDTVVLEVSSHALDQQRIAGINLVQALFTNITQDHLDYHQNFENYQQTKAKLFHWPSLKTVVINKDDKHWRYFFDQASCKNKLTYDLNSFKQIRANEHGFLLHLDDFVFEVPFLGEFNLSNLLCALTGVEALGFDREEIIPLLPKLLTPNGRMQQVENLTAWVDYAHTPDALDKAIQTLKLHFPKHKIHVLFGCGGNRDQDKRAKMGAVASKFANQITLTNDNPRDENPEQIIADIVSGISNEDKVCIIADRKAAIENAIKNLSENECLLIAGKGHESTQQFRDKIVSFNDLQVAKNALN